MQRAGPARSARCGVYISSISAKRFDGVEVGRPELRRDRLFITYTPVEPDCLAAVREAVDRYGHFREVFETSAGCTVSCHCGPGTLGVLFIRQ